MPLFEYRCEGCEARVELLVRGSDTPSCPQCGSTALEKLLSAFSVSGETAPATDGACGTCGDPRGPGT